MVHSVLSCDWCCLFCSVLFLTGQLQQGLQQKGKEIERKVSLTQKDKNKSQDRVEGITKRIEKLQAEANEIAAKKKVLSERVEQCRVAEAKARNGLPAKKKDQSDEDFVNLCLAKIEEKCKDLNAQIEASAGSASEERRLLKEVQRVRASKSNIPIYLQRHKALSEARQAEKRSERDLKSKEDFIATLRTELDELKGEIAALDGKVAVEDKPVKEALSTEEQQLTDRLNSLHAQLREASDNLRNNREKWYEDRREKKRKAEEKVAEKRAEEKARRAKEARERAVAEREERKSVIPYQKELGDLVSLLQYLDGLVEQEEAAKKAETAPAAAPATTVAAPQGLVPLKKKEEDDWGAFAANNKKSKGKASKPAQQTQQKSKFVVNFQSIEQFRKQGFTAPMSMEQVPATRAAVKAKLDALQAKSDAERAVTLQEIAKAEADEAAIVAKEKAEEEKAKAAAAAAAAAAAPAKPAEEAKDEKKDEKKENKKEEKKKEEKKPEEKKEDAAAKGDNKKKGGKK